MTSAEKDIVKELRKQTAILQAIADKLGVERPKQKTVTLDNDLVVSVRKDFLTGETTTEDSSLPRQIQSDGQDEPVTVPGGEPFRGDEKKPTQGITLSPEQLAQFQGDYSRI